MVFSTRVDPHWLKKGSKFWYSYETSEGKQYYLVDPVTKSKNVLFDLDALAAEITRLTGDPFDAQHLPITKLKFVKDEKAVQFDIKSTLIDEDEEEEDGDSQEEKKKETKKKKDKKTFHFEYDFNAKSVRLLDDYEKPDDHPDWASISPNKEYVVFAKNENLYWMDWENYEKALEDDKDSTIVEHQWTTDGIKHFSYARTRRGQSNVDIEKNKDKRKPASVLFSPKGDRFALIKSDVRKVKDLWVINNTANPRPTLESYKYQMPGEKEAPRYHLNVFNFQDKSQQAFDVDTFKDQSINLLRAPRLKKNRDDELQFNIWLSPHEDKLYFYRTSRDLKRIDLCLLHLDADSTQVLVEERMNTYLDVQPIKLLNGGEEFILWSERDGWGHYYLYDKNGTLKNQITKGPFHCELLEGVDEGRRILYFQANGKEVEEDPYYFHLYRINLDGSGLQLLNKGNFTHQVSLNDENRYFVNTYSRVNTIPVSTLHNHLGQKILDLETADLTKLMESGYRFPQPFTTKADDGITDLYGTLYKPYDFNPERKYPIIAYVYPGPQTEAVGKSFSSRMDRTDRLAQLGFIVITIGNRGGHPDRSKWYHNFGYGNLRDYGLADKKTTIEQLAARYDFIDIDKVGIFGHSGGGFMSTAAMLVYPDFFKVAVSSSGNHENNIYNRWWSEKHHGVKEIVNKKGETKFEYKIDKNPDIAKNLKGKLLITTGDIDNNVHPANTIRLAQALIKANKRFDYFVFPGQRHGYGNMTEYFFWLRADYFVEHLLGHHPRSVDILEINRDQPKRH